MRLMKTRRIGKFDVSLVFFDRLDVGEGLNLFDRMVVLEATANFYTCKVHYTAVHPDFDEVAEGQIIPLYVATFFDGCAVPAWRLAVKEDE